MLDLVRVYPVFVIAGVFAFDTVSYTHLDVYKRQAVLGKRAFFLRGSVPAKSRKVNAAFPFFGHLYLSLIHI